MRKVTLAFFALVLLVAPLPVSAQTATPPPVGQVASAIEQTNAILQQQGALVVFALVFAVLVGIVAWVAIKPTISNNTASNNALIQSSGQFIALAQDNQRIISQSTEVHRGVQTGLSEAVHTMITIRGAIEANTTALIAHVSSEREAGVVAVTEFALEQHQETRRLIEQAVNQAVGKIEARVDAALLKWDEIMPRIENRLKVQDDTIRISLMEIHSELVSSKQEAQKAKIETGNLAPPVPDIWQGDTPDEKKEE